MEKELLHIACRHHILEIVLEAAFTAVGDYRDLLELSIIFLGGIPPRGISFKASGGIHRARWIAKAIYSMKLWMFRAQFKLSPREEIGLKAVCDFIIKVYLKAWYLAPVPQLAPAQDLWLLKELQRYHNIHPKISAVTLKKFQGHL
ncbi:hypothetical protein Hamer_G010380 [Homarus americanus]|uniref:Uncharacterized protein n=1 Tax=Homarus americanus TaxID=6706 RepID=A0A8J5MW71_HOMAM|nr:hypothetical protein Hamer_G010380 [Homarus americanus]